MVKKMNSDESCVYCSKCMIGLNDFNKKMHIQTCKVRKIVDDNPNSGAHLGLEDYMEIGENCTYCFKSFKDFKSEFNKRLHVKCCKIKKETNEEKRNMKANLSTGESCVFCMKPLENLNDFNKRMHMDNCKIRKSMEGISKKDSALINAAIDLGDSCSYCGKSFANLSNFNKRLHFDYCKLKKKKLNSTAPASLGNDSSVNNNLNNSNNLSHLTHLQQQQHQQQLQQLQQQQQQQQLLNSSQGQNLLSNYSHINQMQTINNVAAAAAAVNSSNSAAALHHQQNNHHHHHQQQQQQQYDLGETCLFCSRSLKNLSNFNKKIHIETCKVKKIKIATAKLRQEARKATRKSAPKKERESQISSFVQNPIQKVAMNSMLNMNQLNPIMHLSNLNSLNSLSSLNSNNNNSNNGNQNNSNNLGNVSNQNVMNSLQNNNHNNLSQMQYKIDTTGSFSHQNSQQQNNSNSLYI